MPGASRLTVVAAGLGLLAAAGCTISSNPAADSVGRAARSRRSAMAGPRLGAPVPGAPTVEISAPVEPEYDDVRFRVSAGTVNIAFTTTGNHNVTLEGPGIPDPLLWGEPAGAVEDHLTYSVTLRKGTYLFFCSVQGHRAAGMEGRIVAT